MILDKLFWITAILGSISALTNIIGANIYDLKQVKLQRQRTLRPHARRYRRRPLVSVIVTTQNDASTIADCLQSLVKSHYRKLEIIVADNASQDNTSHLVREFIADHPKKQLRLYAKRLPSDKFPALAYAYNKYVSGQLIMVLDKPCLVDKAAIVKAVRHFNDEPLDILEMNYKIQPSLTTAGLFQEFWLLLRNRAKKATCSFKSTYLADSQSAAVYSTETFAKWLKQDGWEPLQVSYASDAVVCGQALSFYGVAKAYYSQQMNRLALPFSVPAEYRQLNRQFWPLLVSLVSVIVALALPILLTYFTYLAIRLHEPDFLVMSWVALALFLLFAIWEDEQLRLQQKLKYVMLMPMTYGWFYLMSLVHYLVLLTSFRVIRAKKT